MLQELPLADNTQTALHVEYAHVRCIRCLDVTVVCQNRKTRNVQASHAAHAYANSIVVSVLSAKGKLSGTSVVMRVILLVRDLH